MNQQVILIRKVAYLVAMGVLLMPIFWLSHTATRGSPEHKGRQGGLLTRLRDDYHISQTQLGEIDPTAETIKLATLGMRGIAADVLWWQANNYQMKKDWLNLRITLEQISKLQPHFIAVWRHQAWNLSYNVSASFDDYHDKYYWVIEGIKFLQQGVALNDREPRLLWDLGWFISQKIGRADEKELYRRLFKEDDKFHGDRPVKLRDNWLVGKEWFRAAEDITDTYHVPVKGMAPVIFYSHAPLCQMSYAEGLEKDGQFDEATLLAWKGAAREWRDYGDRPVDASSDVEVHLNDVERHEALAKEKIAALEELAPGLRQKIVEEKKAALRPGERPEDVQDKLRVTHDEVARRVAGDARDEARKLAREIAQHQLLAEYTRREREKVNFDYWQRRAEVEQTPLLFQTRKKIYEANVARADNRLVDALPAYEQGLKGWRDVLDQYPDLKEQRTVTDDVMDAIKRYRWVMDRQEEKRWPKPFILQDVLDMYEKRQ